MGIAGDLNDGRLAAHRIGQVQTVIAAESVGVQITAISLEEVPRTVARAVDREIEDVEGMLPITPVNPQMRLVRGVRVVAQILDDRIVGVQPTREQHVGHHQVIKRPQ